jgi:hypothetical protein
VVKLRGREPGAWLFELVQDTWARSTGAWRVQVEELRTHVGALHYLWLDQAKSSQLPPQEWRGMVDRGSRGYFAEPVGVLRERARLALWAESLAFATGLDLGDAEFLVGEAQALRAEETTTARERREWVAEAKLAASCGREASEPQPTPAGRALVEWSQGVEVEQSLFDVALVTPRRRHDEGL